MDFTTLQSRVLSRLQMGTDDPAAVSVGDLVNEGLHLVEIADPTGWSWLHRVLSVTWTASAASTAFADLSSSYDIAKIDDVTVLDGANYYPLTQVSSREGNRLYTSTAASMIGVWWSEGETLYVKPAPSATTTMSVAVVVTEPDLVGSASPIMPTRYHASIVQAALVTYYATLQDVQRQETARGELDRWIERMRRAEMANIGPSRVRVRDPLFNA